MNYNQATLRASTGDKILLPGWTGYFYWNYSNNTFEFRNGDYHLNEDELKRFNLDKRNDWYYII